MKQKLTSPTRMEPSHPGAVLRDDVLPALGIPVAEAARDLGVTRQTLHRILAEEMAVSPEMALRLGRFCGNGPNLWLRMQQAYDLWHAEHELAADLDSIRPRARGQREHEGLLSMFENAFRPIRAVARLADYNSKLEVRIFTEPPILFRAPLEPILRSKSGVRASIKELRDRVESRGYKLAPLSNRAA